ncbi:hypothetical protein [Nocardia sp. NBC_00511]|uniref:hypothetical protein n=1 Tax=Nocardia sp. NBC_00511 TaxID=2903591 RepID=UPI0030E57595
MIKRLTSTAMLAIGATTIAVGAAHAQPGIDQVSGVDQGVSYTTGPNRDGRSVTTTLDAGHFGLSDDGRMVTIFDRSGTAIATLPMAIQVAETKYPLEPRIDEAGQTLTLSPVGAPIPSPAQSIQAQRQFVDAAADLNRHQYNAGVGALIGLGIGILLGLPFDIVGAIPGGVIGAGIGALIGWVLP